MPEKIRQLLNIFTGTAMTMLVFLLPLKFGGLAVMPESGGFYPEDLFSWLFASFPPHAIGIAGAVTLIAAVVTLREIDRKTALLTAVWSLVPAVAAIPGAVYGFPDETFAEISNLLGVGAFSAAAGLLITADKVWGRRLAAAFVCGGMYCAAYGIHQYFTGLAELREFAAEQMRKGIQLPESLQLKLTDPRIFSTMASSNALASLLLILTPPAIYFALHWSRYFEPVKISRILFMILTTGIIGTALVMSSARSALICPAAAVILAAVSYRKIPWHFRAAAAVAAVVIAAGGIFFAVRYGRGAASMVERADYLRSCAILTVQHPAAGGGWGSFFRTHMTVKLSGTDEAARDPHNVVAAFAAQAGVLPAVFMLAVLAVPLAMLWKQRFTPGLSMAVFWSGVLFTLHSLMDCDWHVPALPAVMGVLYMAAWSEIAPAEKKDLSLMMRWTFAGIFLILAAAAFFTNYRYLQGDKALARLQDRLMPTTAAQAAVQQHLFVPELAEQLRQYRPSAAISYLLEGDWYFSCRDIAAAEKCYKKALELDPYRPGILAKLARIAVLQGNRPEAIRRMEQAQKLFPKNPRYDVNKFIAGELL